MANIIPQKKGNPVHPSSWWELRECDTSEAMIDSEQDYKGGKVTFLQKTKQKKPSLLQIPQMGCLKKIDDVSDGIEAILCICEYRWNFGLPFAGLNKGWQTHFHSWSINNPFLSEVKHSHLVGHVSRKICTISTAGLTLSHQARLCVCCCYKEMLRP